MKYIFSFLFASTLSLTMAVVSFAEDAHISNVNLTIVIPSKEVSEEINSIPELTIPKVYPVSVYETSENGIRQVIKTYELSDDELPSDIPRDSFERNNRTYELADIIKKEKAFSDVREHTKTITINTDTKEFDAIAKLLAQTIEYKSDDEYTGILNLDLNSIIVETAGTKKETFTVSAVREYPNLSSNDTSLIPKTINDSGRTLTFSGVEWKTQTISPIDYQQLPNSYTAISTYTGTETRTVTTGYSVKADYKGLISKMVNGKTVYTAIFNGSKIPPKPVEMIEQQINEEVIVNEEIKTNRLIHITLFTILVFAFMSGIAFFMMSKKFKKLETSKIEELPIIEELEIKKDYKENDENDKKGEIIL